MEVFPGFLLLLFFTAHNTFCKPLEDEEAGKMLLNEGQFLPGIWKISSEEEAEVMRQSPGLVESFMPVSPKDCSLIILMLQVLCQVLVKPGLRQRKLK